MNHPRLRGRVRFFLGVEGLEGRITPADFTEVEANNSVATANVVTVSVGDVLTTAPVDWLAVHGTVGAVGDLDYFQLTLAAPSGVFFDVDSRETGLSTTLNSLVQVYDAGGVTVIGSNDNGYDFEGFATPVNSVGVPQTQDSSLYLDLAAGTYFVRVSGGTTAGQYDLRLLADPNYPTAVPVFNSLPGAVDTLYLDFDGHSATDSWGTYTAAGYSIDGTATTYSPGERLAIRNTWMTVAEDYSPFAINITTVNPGTFNNGQAFRQVVTNSPGTIVGAGGALGVAFLNSYVGGAVNTAFTFASAFSAQGGGVSGQIMAAGVEMGNTSSHEFGHTLGLDHFSTSAGPFFLPNAIMATPDNGFNREVWGVGTNDSNGAQDDMAIISNATNTFGYRIDDHGNTTATATVLTATAGVSTATGVIGKISGTPDVDYFQITAGGATQIFVSVNPYVSNLDVELRLFDGTGVLVATDDPTGSFSASLSKALAAGTYYVEVRSDGEMGEAGQYTVRVVNPDPNLPTSAVTFPATGGSYGLATWTGAIAGTAADVGSGVQLVEVSVRRASTGLYWNGTAFASATEVFVPATGTTAWSLAFPAGNFPPGEGAYAVRSRATDAAGNVEAPGAAVTFTIDPTPPPPPVLVSISADTGVSPTDRVTADSTLVFAGTAEANTVVEVFKGGVSVGTTTADGAGSWTFDYTGTVLADGSYPFTARARDPIGNVSAESAVFTVTVDTSAPAAPAVAAVTTDSGTNPSDGVTNDNKLVFAGTAEANAFVEVFRGGAPVGTTQANAAGAWSFDYAGTTLADGAYQFTARASDAAGNVGGTSAAFAVVIDTAAPVAPGVAAVTTDSGTSPTDGVTNDNKLVFAGTAEAGSRVEVFRGGTPVGTVTADGSGNWTFDHTGTTLADGTYQFTAKATDLAGNVSPASANFRVVIDTTAPTVPAVQSIGTDSGLGGDGITSDNTLTVSGRAEPSSSVAVFRDGAPIGTVVADGAGNWTFDHTGTVLADGTYRFSTRATDAAGNASVVSGDLTAVVDTATPAAPAVTGVSADTGVSPSDGATSDNTLLVSGTAEAGAVVEVFRNGTPIGTVIAGPTGGWAIDGSGTTLTDGSYRFTARATDKAGNVSPVSAIFTVVVDTAAPVAPIVTGVTPDTGSGPADGVTNDNTPTVSGIAEPGAVVSVFGNGNLLGTAAADPTGVWAFDAATLADGKYQFTARAADLAGNVSGVSAAFAAVVDTAAPAGLALGTAAVAENLPAGTVIGLLAATDTTSKTLTYALVPGAGDGGNGLFRIETGRVVTNVPLDFEAVAGYSVRVRVTDEAGNDTEAALGIGVLDVNEAPVAVTFIGGAVVERTSAGTVVGRLAAVDPDRGDRVTYTLLDGAGGRFTGVGDEVRVLDGGRLDAAAAGSHVVRVRATDAGGLSLDTDLLVTVQRGPAPPIPPYTVPTRYAVGADRDGGDTVTLFDSGGSVRSVIAFGGNSPGGVRTAAGDVTGDGVEDLVVGTGPGRPTLVRVLDGKTGREVFAIEPFEASFTGGVFVAVGDLNGEGAAEVVITPDQGGGPRVRIFSGRSFAPLADFLGIDDPGFRGGARAAIADVNGDGIGDLMVAAGFGGGPRLAVFDGTGVFSGPTPPKLVADFFVFEQTLRNGVYVTGGDLDGDGFADLIAGGGPGGGPRVFALSGRDLVDSGGAAQTVVANFFGGDVDNREGVRVAAKDLDGGAATDLVIGVGPGAGSQVTTYAGETIRPSGTPPVLSVFDAYPGFNGGVFVG